jgi:hypothetical protein
VADSVRQDEEEAGGIQRLPGAEQLPGKFRPEELRAAARGAVKDQDGIAHHPLPVALRPAKCAEVDAKRRHDRAGPELEVRQHEIPFDGCGIVRGRRAQGREEKQRQPDSFGHKG